MPFTIPTYYKGKLYNAGEVPKPESQGVALPKGYQVIAVKGTLASYGTSDGFCFKRPLGANGQPKQVIDVQMLINNFPSGNDRMAPPNRSEANLKYSIDYEPVIDAGNNAGKSGINIWNLTADAMGREFVCMIAMVDSDAFYSASDDAITI